MRFQTAVFTSLAAGAAMGASIPAVEDRAAAAGAAISGLDATQSGYAHDIMNQVRSEGLPKQACLAAIATALQESTLYMYANPTVPKSMNLPHDKVGSNFDSVGLFQQRLTYYPNLAADMNAAQSAGQFLAAMKAISGWQTMNVSDLCQAVQHAAAGNLYGQRVAEATTICKAGGFS